MSRDDLDKRIKYIEKMVKVLDRLKFVRYRYKGYSVEDSCERVGISKMMGYTWQKRWNRDGYVGLIPRYSGGRPSKLNQQQKEELQIILKQGVELTTVEIKDLIEEKYGVAYSLKQIRVIVKDLKSS